MTKTQWALLVALAVLAFVLRVWAADQVAPYVPDTQIIREAMDLGQKIATGSGVFDVGMSGAAKYPLVLPYILLAMYGVIFVGGRLIGVFHSIQDFTGWLFLNRVTMHVVTVTLIALLSALAVPLTFFIARRFEKRIAPWVAATLVTFSLLLIQFSHHARPHVPVAFFLLLSIYFSLRVYETGTLRDYVLAGASVALASGTLQNGVLALIPFITAHLLRIGLRSPNGTLESSVNWRLAAALVVCGTGILAAYPQLIFRPQGVASIVSTQSGESALLVGGQTGTGLDGFQLRYVPKNFAYLLGYEPVLAVLGPVGLIYYFFRTERRREHVILASLAVTFSLTFLLLRFTLPHYFSPLIPVLSIFAARLLADLTGFLDRNFPGVTPTLSISLGGLFTVVLAAYAFRMDYLLGQTDTRAQARDWMVANLPPNAEIATEFRLEVYSTQDSIRRQQTEVPGSLGTLDQWLSQLSPREYPAPTLALTNLDVYSVNNTIEIEALLAKHNVEYLVFEQYMAGPRTDYLVYDYALTHGTRVAIFCPISPLDAHQYYALPDDISLPWTELWTIHSPGPIVQIFSTQASRTEQSRVPPC